LWLEYSNPRGNASTGGQETYDNPDNPLEVRRISHNDFSCLTFMVGESRDQVKEL
jgi:hypothetical protein